MMDRPKDIYAPLAVQNWVEYADWLKAENAALIYARSQLHKEYDKLHHALEVIAGKRQTIHTHMSNVDIAKAALEPASSTVTGKLMR
jgi:hypothetical protein